jgi:hypothetical protein
VAVNLGRGRSLERFNQPIFKIDDFVERFFVVAVKLQNKLVVHGPFLAA